MLPKPWVDVEPLGRAHSVDESLFSPGQEEIRGMNSRHVAQEMADSIDQTTHLDGAGPCDVGCGGAHAAVDHAGVSRIEPSLTAGSRCTAT